MKYVIAYLIMTAFVHLFYSYNNPTVSQKQLFFMSLGSPILISFALYYSIFCPLFLGFEGRPVMYMTGENNDEKK